MNILLVDNGSFYLDKLINLIPQANLQISSYNNLRNISLNKFDAVILSGGHSFSVVYHEPLYQGELNLIRSLNIPTLGICLGCELIAFAFGAKLERMESKEKGLIQVTVNKPDPIFDENTSFVVYESHRWAIKNTPKDLESLAISKDGVEVIKHKTKKIYGMQFHPEAFPDVTTGNRLFLNFFDLVF